MPHALNLSVRRVGAGVVAVAVVLAGAIVLEASPAAAAGAYEGSRSPLSYGGTDYVDTGAGNGVLYYDGTNDATVVVDNDFEELDIVDGTDDVHVALVSSGGLNMTMYLTAAAFDDAPGGPVTPNCANVDALYFGGGPACVAFKTSIQRANGNGYDYQFDGFYGFVDASDNPLFGEPTVTPGYVDPPEIRYAVSTLYDGSASPFALNGADYNTSPDASGTGAHWWAMDSNDGPAWIQSGHAPIPGLPSMDTGGIPPVHAVLVDVYNEKATLYIEDTFLGILDPMNPFSADCPGFDALYATMTAPDPSPITCDAFRADMWGPPGTLGETYTCAADWYVGWTDDNGDALDRAVSPTIIEGYELPALTLTGETTGPGACQAAPPPDPPTPPDPDNPGTPTRPGDSGAGTRDGTTPAGTTPTGTTGTVPTLPATGATTPVLLLAAALLLVGGTVTTRVARSRRVDSGTHTR